jgi:NTP pyrophosphatase (non-canonical NTP hydrolase)
MKNKSQLATLVADSHKTAKQKGFWDKPRNTGELLMLIVSELGEALEADRKSKHCALSKPILKKVNEKKLPEEFKEVYEKYVKGSFEEEIADTFIRLFDLCGGLKINIEEHIALKMRYNQSREKLHGKSY